MGLRVGGKITGGSPLVDAQLVGYVNTSLSFQASASGKVTTSTGTVVTSYRYGVYLLYNLGYGAYARIKFFPNWALTPRNAYPKPKNFTIYEQTGSFTGPISKRSIDAPLDAISPKLPRRGLIGDWHGTELTSLDHVHLSHRHLHRKSKVEDRSSDLNHNASAGMSLDSLLGKRADDSLPNSQQADFSTQLTCPPGDTGQVRLPDFRRKLHPRS